MRSRHPEREEGSSPLDPNAYSPQERAMFAALPKEAAAPMDVEERTQDALVASLRAEGFFHERALRREIRMSTRRSRALRAAAAVVVFSLGAGVGTVYGAQRAGRHSLEAMLARTDLSLDDRVLLLQRAGSAYVRAANRYAEGTRQNDSTAVEVATQVLMGAAQAVAGKGLDGGMMPRLAAMLRDGPTTTPVSGRPSTNIIWY